MAHLELTAEEQEVLTQALEHQVYDLKDEITHTDAADYKEILKHRKAVLDRVLSRLRGQPVEA